MPMCCCQSTSRIERRLLVVPSSSTSPSLLLPLLPPFYPSCRDCHHWNGITRLYSQHLKHGGEHERQCNVKTFAALGQAMRSSTRTRRYCRGRRRRRRSRCAGSRDCGLARAGGRCGISRRSRAGAAAAAAAGFAPSLVDDELDNIATILSKVLAMDLGAVSTGAVDVAGIAPRRDDVGIFKTAVGVFTEKDLFASSVSSLSKTRQHRNKVAHTPFFLLVPLSYVTLAT